MVTARLEPLRAGGAGWAGTAVFSGSLRKPWNEGGKQGKTHTSLSTSTCSGLAQHPSLLPVSQSEPPPSRLS